MGRDRPSHVYRPSTAGLATLPSDPAFEEYRGLTEAFAIHLSRQATDPAEEARAVGHAWGMQLAQSQTRRVELLPFAEPGACRLRLHPGERPADSLR